MSIEQLSIRGSTPTAQIRHLGELVLGVSDRNSNTAVYDAFQTLTGEPLLPEVIERYDSYALPDFSRLDEQELGRVVMTKGLKQIFGEEGVMKQHNPLRSWPMDEHMYATYAQAKPQVSPAGMALLVGDAHPLSKQAFVVQARETYRTRWAVSIDPNANPDKTLHGLFRRGDGRNMPFDDESIRVVQTNHLFNCLGERGFIGKIATKESRALKIMREAFRVLEPGGHLLLNESGIGGNLEKPVAVEYKQRRMHALRKMLLSCLPEIGFIKTVVEPAFDMPNVDFLFDRSRDFGSYATTLVPGTIGVYARKP